MSIDRIVMMFAGTVILVSTIIVSVTSGLLAVFNRVCRSEPVTGVFHRLLPAGQYPKVTGYQTGPGLFLGKSVPGTNR